MRNLLGESWVRWGLFLYGKKRGRVYRVFVVQRDLFRMRGRLCLHTWTIHSDFGSAAACGGALA